MLPWTWRPEGLPGLYTYVTRAMTVQCTQEHNMLGQSPDEIAKFLAKTTGLNKTMVGEYLGEREDMCLKVMHAYVDAMNFADLQFDEAIR